MIEIAGVRTVLLRVLAGVVLTVVASSVAAAAAKWLPLDPAEFARTESPIDPEAGAEVLFREITVDASDFNSTRTTYHIRTRVYSERGVEKLAKVEIPYSRGGRVRDVEARTLKPDGTILELARGDVYDREVLKAGNVRVKVKSFAPPGLEPGVIVEYTYRVIEYRLSFFFVLDFQDELPARRVQFRVRPLADLPFGLRALFFNVPNQELKDDRRGYFTFELQNVPAWKEEPFQPPKIQVRKVAVLYYVPPGDFSAAPLVQWRAQAQALHQDCEKEAKVTKPLREAAARIVDLNATPNEKLEKIYRYCRTEIVNRDHLPDADNEDRRKRLPRNLSAADTLRHRSGSSYDINVLFAALVRASGLHATFARCNDRSLILFDRSVVTPFALSDFAVAVNDGENWRFFAPGSRHLPFGILDWKNTGTTALIGDPNEAVFENIDSAPAQASVRHRTGTLRLDADGTLEGDVTVVYTGHWDAQMKEQFADGTPEDHRNAVRDEVQRTLKLAEVSDVAVENVDDPLAPVKVTFHLRVPEYAERTGSRLFFQPAVFQKGETALFTEPTRNTAVIFRHRYTERDELSIAAPTGFTLEAGSAPQDLAMGGLGKYTVSIRHSVARATLTYTRQLTVDGVMVPHTHYEGLRTAFEVIHSRDNHTLTLRRGQRDPEAAPAAATIDAGAPTP